MVLIKNSPMAPTHLFHHKSILKSIIGTFTLLFVFLLSACGTSPSTTAGTTATPTSTTSVSQKTDTATPEATVTVQKYSTTTVYPIKVYFSKFPDSTNSLDAVFPVDRTSPSLAVATFSIQLLIAGPTLSERSAGYFSELNSILSGPSNCSAPHLVGGPDFTVTLNMRGSKTQQGTATLRFCRITNSPGIGADAHIQSEIHATLKQFSNIKDVVILTQDGNCFGDGSGLNNCLK